MDQTCNFFFEAGELKRVKRSGWWTAGIKDPESVAEHSYRTAIIAFVLAKMEGLDANKLCTAALFHDLREARLLDRHKISQKYLDTPHEVEDKIILEQAQNLPNNAKQAFLDLNKLTGIEKTVFKDADLLECAFQAKEYMAQGCAAAEDWLCRAGQCLKSRSGKKVFAELQTASPSDWWRGLKKEVERC